MVTPVFQTPPMTFIDSSFGFNMNGVMDSLGINARFTTNGGISFERIHDTIIGRKITGTVFLIFLSQYFLEELIIQRALAVVSPLQSIPIIGIPPKFRESFTHHHNRA
jgi:hypothetical protein